MSAHPAEPAPVVTEEFVGFICAGLYVGWEHSGEAYEEECRQVIRRLATAAAPLLGPRPLLDRESLAEEIFRATPMQVSRKSSRDAADIALRLTRPMPTREQIAEAAHGSLHRSVGIDCVGSKCSLWCDAEQAADAVLALINQPAEGNAEGAQP